MFICIYKIYEFFINQRNFHIARKELLNELTYLNTNQQSSPIVLKDKGQYVYTYRYTYIIQPFHEFLKMKSIVA